MRVDIHTDDFDAVCGKCGSRRQANIAETENTNLLEVHSNSLFDEKLMPANYTTWEANALTTSRAEHRK